MLLTPVDCLGAFRCRFARLPARASSRDHAGLPGPIIQSASTVQLFEACSSFTPVTARQLAHSPFPWAWSEGFDTTRYQAAPLLRYSGIPNPPVVGLSPTGGLRVERAQWVRFIESLLNIKNKMASFRNFSRRRYFRIRVHSCSFAAKRQINRTENERKCTPSPTRTDAKASSDGLGILNC